MEVLKERESLQKKEAKRIEVTKQKENKRIYLASPHMGGLEESFIKEAFDTNWIAPLGPNVNNFEKEVAEYVGIKDAAALVSGTSAIHLAIKLLAIKEGDTVFCSDLTFAASCNPIMYEKATPVFIDSEYESFNMSPIALKKAFECYEKKGILPKAVIVVHLYGQAANMDEIMEICNKYNVPVIEDAAESLGATYKGQQTGTFGKYGIYSFNGNKIITTSGGGMLVSNDDEAIKKARFWSTQSRDNARYYKHTELGYNYRMSNIVAGIGRGQIRILNERIAQKKYIYEKYKEAFLEKLKEVREIGKDLTLTLPEAEMGCEAEAGCDASTAVFTNSGRNRVYTQKQPGLYSVHCHPVGGTPDPSLFVNLYKAICEIPGAELRLCPDESFYVINCREEDLEAVLHVTEDSAKTIFEESVACIGAHVCQQGIRDSQGLLQKLVGMERNEQFADGILPKIHISGCPSSCGTHQIGVIGFRGGAKTIDKVLKPAFNLYINGSDIQGQERMGEEVGTLLEEQIPDFLCALGHAVSDSGMDFDTWFAKNPEGIKAIAASFLV